ncbi:hypothetical protein ZEAMMB73_Zm00001d014017, partial [Zea mays]
SNRLRNAGSPAHAARKPEAERGLSKRPARNWCSGPPRGWARATRRPTPFLPSSATPARSPSPVASPWRATPPPHPCQRSAPGSLTSSRSSSSSSSPPTSSPSVTGSTGSPRTGPGSPRGARSTKGTAPAAGCLKPVCYFSPASLAC